MTVAPSITVAGLGIRVGRASGPLLDAGVTSSRWPCTSSARCRRPPLSGGAQLQLTNLGVAVSGASGGNAIASGMLKDSGSSGQKPQPSFSPALAVQKHGTGPVEVTLRAGDGDGPWWVAIQKGFGPLYLEQVGFGVTMPQRKVESISLLLDARVSLFGLNASVDDLSITYFVSDGDFFAPASWKVDLGGLAISAEIGPLAIAGGLLKNGSGENVEYLGMLLGRFGVYGLTDLRRLRQEGRHRLVLRHRRRGRADRRRARVLRHRHRRRLRHQPAPRRARPTCRSSATTR